MRAEHRSFKSVLDLGCGTGLCGPLVKPHAARLTGADLFAAMLDKARALGVFIYVGALEAVFAGVASVLQAGGIFCFSVEKASNAVNWQLTPGMRYAHSARYLRALAAQHGFDVLQMLAHAVRHDQRQAIDGLFVYLPKR